MTSNYGATTHFSSETTNSSNPEQFDIKFGQAELDLAIIGGCLKVSIAAKSLESK